MSIGVEVAYAGAEGQWLLAVALPDGACIADAIRESGVERHVPALAGGGYRVGIFSRLATMETVLADGDRVEIYRPLIADPKEVRRQRAVRERTGGRRGG